MRLSSISAFPRWSSAAFRWGAMCCFFFWNDTPTTEIYTSVHTLSLHDALPIYLPPDHRTVLAVMVCQGCDDLPRIPPVDSSRRAVVAAAAEANPHAVRIHRDDLRVPLDEPRRGRRRRRAQHHAEIVLAEELQRVVQPGKCIASRRRLNLRPGKLPDAPHAHAGVGHELGVDGPASSGPLLGVIVDPHQHLAVPARAHRHGHAFTAPAMMPSMKRFCRMRKTTMRGSVSSTDPARMRS